jgi:hypothetical protein
MMEFDQKYRLVSFRSIFHNTITWEEFDLLAKHPEDKQKK